MSIRSRGMSRSAGVICSAVATLALLTVTASATTVRPMTFDELVAEAVTIVRGEVVDVRSAWRDGEANGLIVTLVTVRVQRTLKGAPSLQLLLEFLGGTIGAQTLSVSDGPQFKVGDREILFIDEGGRPASPIVGFFVGRFPIHVDAFTRRDFVTTFDGRPFSDTAGIGAVRATSLSTMRAGAGVRGEALSVRDVESLIVQRLDLKR